MSDVISKRSFLISLCVHLVIVLAIAIAAAVQGCVHSKEPLEITEFTIAVDPADEPEAEPEKVEAKEPEKVEQPPPKPDDVVVEKPKPPKKPKAEKPKEKKKEEPKKAPEKPKTPKKKPIKKGRRVVAEPPKERQRLSDEEVDKYLNEGATIGPTTKIPSSQEGRDASILQNTLIRATNFPRREECGRGEAVVYLEIGNGGVLKNPRIVRSSGSKVFDNSCIDAVKSVKRISGLSSAFIKKYGSGCSVTFTLP